MYIYVIHIYICTLHIDIKYVIHCGSSVFSFSFLCADFFLAFLS